MTFAKRVFDQVAGSNGLILFYTYVQEVFKITAQMSKNSSMSPGQDATRDLFLVPLVGLSQAVLQVLLLQHDEQEESGVPQRDEEHPSGGTPQHGQTQRGWIDGQKKVATPALIEYSAAF